MPSKKKPRPAPAPELATTERQEEYLRFIRDFHLKEGYPPTLDELAEHMEVKVGSVQSVLKSLQAKNLVTWKKGQYRTLTLVKKG